MRITLNLATRPFVELNRIYRQLRIAIAVLALVAVGLGIWLSVLNASARQEQLAVDMLNRKAESLQRERATNQARLRQPQNEAALQRNAFLNNLFARKSFSWTAVLMDLEQVLPSGVQVSAIEPAIAPSGEVTIRLRVLGDRDKTVEFVRNLENSRRFIAPRLVGETQQARDRSAGGATGARFANGQMQPIYEQSQPGTLPPVAGVEFEINAGYNPLQPTIREGINGHAPSPVANEAPAPVPAAAPPTISHRVPAAAARTTEPAAAPAAGHAEEAAPQTSEPASASNPAPNGQKRPEYRHFRTYRPPTPIPDPNGGAQ